MKKIESVALIGLGAIGSAYLVKMAEHMPPESIRVIASGERAARYRANGVEYNGRHYRFNVAEPESGEKPADLVFVSVKNMQLEQAARDMRDFVGPETIIIAPLNGVTSEKVLMTSFGEERVLFSYAMRIDATRVGDSTVCTDTGYIAFGCGRGMSCRPENEAAVAEFFERVGIEYEMPDDMMTSLWKKFMMNCGINQTSAVLGFTYGLMQRSREARSIMRSAMEEAALAAKAEGISLGTADIDNCFNIMDRLGPDGKTSMLQDIDARRATEVDAFAGTVVSIAGKYNIPVPVNEMLLRLIRAKEESFALAAEE